MLSKTTLNYAEKRNFRLTEVSAEETERFPGLMAFDMTDPNNGDPLFQLVCDDNGGFSWHHFLHIPAHIREEVPGHMANETELRRVLDFIYSELSATS